MKDSLGNEIVMGKRYGSFVRLEYVEDIPYVVIGVAEENTGKGIPKVKLKTVEVRKLVTHYVRRPNQKVLPYFEYEVISGEELEEFKYKDYATPSAHTVFPI